MKFAHTVAHTVVLTGIALLLAANAHAADDNDQRLTTIGVALGQDRLSNDTPDWRERTVQIQQQFAKRHLVDVELSETQRFGLRDSRLGISYTVPLSEQLTATLDAGVSPTHRVIPKNMLGAGLQIEFAPAWLLHVGARTTNYDTVTVNQALFGLEHYFSNFSWAVNWRSAHAFGKTVNSGDVRGTYFYGDKSSVGIIAAAGNEVANVGTSVVLAPLRSVAIVGRHWLDRRWALNYSVSHTRQGDFYNKNGINLGVQYAF